MLKLVEERDSGQIRWIAAFLAWVWGVEGAVWRATDIRGLDLDIGDAMLAVMDAVRHGRIGVDQMADDADRRVPQALRDWGLMPPAED